MNRVIAVLLVVGLLLGGGAIAALSLSDGDAGPGTGSGSPSTSPSTSPAPDSDATEPPDPALAPFYDQQVEWEPCPDEDEFDCADVTVPLDYDRPEGETIDLAVLRVPAEGDRIGSLVVNPGGPGAPGTDYAAQAGTTFLQPVLDGYDVVGFDPRGTGDSAPVDCLSDEQLDAYIAGDPDPETSAERAEYASFVRGFGAGCAELSGDLAAHVTTTEAARDMDVLRAVLGESRLDYLGASYGTKLGATYADLFPERAGRMLLDGAVDVSLDPRELSLGQAAGFETALRAYVENCLEVTENCFLGSSVEEGLSRIRDFLDEVDASPLPTGGERELAVGNAFYGIVAPLYNRDYWFVLSQALQAGFEGNGAALLQLSDLYSSRGEDGYTDNSSEAIYAINCLDDPYAIPARQVAANVPDFEEASPTFGRVFAWGLTNCGGIQVESTEEPRSIRAEGADPIVVIGTTRDPATPYEWAQSLADQLDSGVLVTREGDGHTAYNTGNDCIDRAVHAYLLEGTVPDDGLTC